MVYLKNVSDKGHMRRILIIGASHAYKLGNEFKKLEGGKFKVEVYAQPGARFEDIQFPDLESCTELDVIVFLCLGNDVFKKNSHRVERTRQGKLIHLDSYQPSSETHLIRIANALEKRIRNCRGHCFVLDNFYKHLRCCRSHKDSNQGLLGFQKKFNAFIRRFFANICTVVDHTYLLFDTSKERRNEWNYRKLQRDSVHFSAEQYLRVASRLLTRFPPMNTIARGLL